MRAHYSKALQSLCACLAAALPALCPAAPLELRWRAEASDPKPYSASVFRGETVALSASLYAYNEPVALDPASACTLYWQTNGMGSAWWECPGAASTNGALSATWSPANDVGAALYSFFLSAETPSGRIYRARGTLRMLGSPGWNPAALPPPSYYPTLAADLLPMLAPSLPTYETWTNLAARVEEVAASASTGTVSSASSDTALRLLSPDADWSVTVAAGTATLWRVEITGSNLLYTFSADMRTLTGEHPPAPSLPYPFTNGLWYGVMMGPQYGVIHGETGATWISAGSGFPRTLSPFAESGEGTAVIDWSLQSSTNAVGTYVTALDLAAALASFNPAAATQALDVAQAAFASATNAQAQAQAVDLRLTSATNAIVRTYFASSNAWIEVDYSNKTAAVVMVGESGTNSVLLSEAGASLDPDATNTIWIAISQNYTALSNALALKADAAWGQYAPDGTPNPEPDYMLWLNRPATMFASGYTWATYGTYAALTADGTVAFESGGEGSLRIGPDPTNHFGYAVGGSVIVGARTDSLTVYGGGTSNGYAEIIYDYEGGGFPVAWFTPALSVAFTEIPDAQWADNLDGTATLTVPATAATGFWRATTTAEIDSVFVSTMPARFEGGVLGGANALPVVYDSVIQIESGGKTYRIPAQEVE